MLSLIYKILALLQLLKCSSQLQPPLRLSTYWQTTYISDKVPDYWDHGSIYVPEHPQTKTEDIFSSWLARAITEPNSHITETTAIEDYEVYIFKTSTDKIFSLNNAQIEKESEILKADLRPDTGSTPMHQTERNRTVPSVITSAEEAKSNSIITKSIFIRALAIKNNNFTRPEYETTLDDFDINPPFTTKNPIVITSPEESIFAESILITTTPRPENSHFTLAEYDTTIDDYDAHPTSTTMHSTVTTEESDSIITDSVFTTTASRYKKNHFTRPEYDTTIDDYDAHPTSTRMHSTVRTEESDSIITDSIFTTTAQRYKKNHFTRPEYDPTIDDYNAYPTSTTMYSTVITTPGPVKSYFIRPEYHTIVYNDDALPPYSTINPSVIKSTGESESNSRITDSIFTNTPPTPEKKHFTLLEYETTVYGDNAHPPVTSMNPSIQTKSKESVSYSTITNSLFTTIAVKADFTHQEFETSIYDDATHRMFITKVLPWTSPYKTTFDYHAHPNSVSMTQTTLTPEYDTKIYDNDAHANSASMTQGSTPAYDTAIYGAYPIFTTMTLPPTATYQTTQKELSTTTTVQISSSKADPKPLIRAVNREITSDPFSVFLQKLLIILSVKRVEDLPLLVYQFKEYLWMLLKGGQLGKLGLYINSYLAKRVFILEKYPIEELRNLFMKYQRVLGNRKKRLPKDINDILDYMDDTYDEAEEEAMQAILNEASLFPNSRHNNKIAQGFIDYVILKPMQRVMGTTRGKVLFKMMTEAVKIRDPAKAKHGFPEKDNEFRKSFNFGKTRSHLSKSPDRSSYELSPLNKLYKRKNEDSEGKIDSSIDNPIENSKIIKSPDDINERSHETEGSGETKESKLWIYYAFKDNDKIVARNGRKHRAFTRAKVITRARKRMISLRKLHNSAEFLNSRYPLKTKLRKFNDNIKIQRNALPNKHRRTTRVNSARFIEAKINHKFKHVNFGNYNASRRMRNILTSTINTPDDSHETDVEKVLKGNIYKAMKKLLNTNTYRKSPLKR